MRLDVAVAQGSSLCLAEVCCSFLLALNLGFLGTAIYVHIFINWLLVS